MWLFLWKKVRVLTTANDVLHAWYVPLLLLNKMLFLDLSETHGLKLKRQEFTGPMCRIMRKRACIHANSC